MVIINGTSVEVKGLTIEHIITYCQEKGEVKWLKEIAATKVEYKVYPRVKVNGEWTTDKSQEPKIEMRPISFIQIKSAFLDKFGLRQPAKTKTSMYDKIANL